MDKIFQSGTNTVTKLASEDGSKLFIALDNNKNILRDTTEMFQAKGESGAGLFRNIFKGKNGIGGHGYIKDVDPNSLVKTTENTVSKGAQLATVGAASLQIANVVVGQINMTEISGKLTMMNQLLSKLDHFNQSKILSELQTANDELNILSSYQNELLANEKVRNNNLQKIERIKHDLTLLNNQATNNIITISENGVDDEQKEISDIKELSEWRSVAVSSQNLMIFASELEFIFGQGIMSKNYSDDLLKTVQERFINSDKKSSILFRESSRKIETF